MDPQKRPNLEEEFERLKETHEALRAIFGLGHDLSGAETPQAMVAAVHGVARRVLPVTLSGLALKGPQEVHLFLCREGGAAESRSVPGEKWEALMGAEEVPLLPGDGRSTVLAELLDQQPLPGRIRSLGNPPAAWLLALGPRPFDPRETELFARIGDFLFSALARWERLEGALRKSRQVADLFVLLAQEKERLDNVVRSVPVGLLLLDQTGAIHLSNDAAAKALGLSPVEVRENKIFGGRPAGRVLLGLLDKARAEGKTVSTPYEMEGRWFQVQVVPWPGMTLFLVVTQDIQEWYGLNRLKEDLISIISHEVKNPLSAIVNAADLLAGGRPGPLNEPQSRLAALILENARNIRGILDDVVRLSRLHHLKGETERVAVRDLIHRLRDGHRDTLQGKLLTWREELEEVHLLCDAGMLENLLANLIGNAVKYAPIGGTVGVRLQRDGERVALRILDDGPGIPPSERDRLFTPFFRASNVRNLVAGTGLGLVIARNVAERLGGRLDCASPLTEEDRLFLGPASAARPGTAFEAVFPFTP